MANCPKCRAEINEDFGLVTCGNCGAQVFLEIDGQPAIAEGEFPTEPPLLDDSLSVADAQLPDIDNEPPPDFVSASRDGNVEPENSIELEFNAEAATQAESMFEVQMPAEPILEKISPSKVFSDVAEFGNSDVSVGREGVLRYNLFILGIDTNDIREEIKSVLNDEKFLWDANKIISSVEDGKLVIRDVSAVKSALLLQRLRAVPVQVRWEQYAIHQV